MGVIPRARSRGPFFEAAKTAVALSLIAIYTGSAMAGTNASVRWSLRLVNIENSSCEGFANGKQCQRVCIYKNGKLDSCGDANYITDEKRFNQLKARMASTELALNRNGQRQLSIFQKRSLEKGFYFFAEDVVPVTRSLTANGSEGSAR